MREIRMLRSTLRGLETRYGRDAVTLATERARQQATQTSTQTGAPVPDPTCERPGVQFPLAYSPQTPPDAEALYMPGVEEPDSCRLISNQPTSRKSAWFTLPFGHRSV